SVQYLIDNSQTVMGHSQKIFPRNNRGLAISPDGRFLYAGYNHSLGNEAGLHRGGLGEGVFGKSGEVRKIDLTVADYEDATVGLLPGPLGKAIAVDDGGRVYLADNDSVYIVDADLKHHQFRVETDDCEGVAVTREGSALVMYTTERRAKILKR